MGVIYCCIWWINCFFCFFIIWNINNLKRNKMKETLEEAAERAVKSGLFKDETLFIAAAKWNQEQIYNEIKELYDNENITGFSKLAYAKCLDIIKKK